MIHNNPPIARIIPLKNNPANQLHILDSQVKKNVNRFSLKKSNDGKETVKKKRNPYEDEVLQPAFARHMDDLQAKQGDFFWFHIPNGGKRHIGVARKLKASGVKAGVADNQVLLHNGKTIFIEVKQREGWLQPSQKDFIRDVSDLGHSVYVIKALHPVDLVYQLNMILRDNGVMV